MLRALSRLADAVPPGAQGKHAQGAEPFQDHCSASQGRGYDPVSYLVMFQSQWTSARVIDWVDRYLRQHGWRAASQATPSTKWAGTAAGHPATVTVSYGQTTPSGPLSYNILATSPSSIDPLNC